MAKPNHDRVWLRADHFSSEFGVAPLPLARIPLDHEVAAFDVAPATQLFEQWIIITARALGFDHLSDGACDADDRDAVSLAGLLCASQQRRGNGGHTGRSEDEIAPPHACPPSPCSGEL